MIPRRALKPWLPSLTLGLGLTLAAGCPSPDVGRGPDTPPSEPATAPRASARPLASGRAGHLVIGLQQEPDKLNSPLNAMVYGTYINQTIYGHFVKYNEKMELVPEVIRAIPTLENGGVSADGLRYEYHLRDDVRWHDGQPLTAADVRFSVEAIMNPNHEIESRLGMDKIASMETPDDHTIVFHLSEPYVKFVEDTFYDEGLMPKHLLEKSVGTGFTANPYHRAPVGCGPFKFEEWVTGSHVTVVRNDDYFLGKPGLERITFRFIPDVNALLVALRAGEIDGYDNAGTDQHPQLKAIAGVNIEITPQLMWEHVDFNVEDPILSDVRVRRAIALAIDREQLSKEIYDGIWPPALGDISPRLKWYNPEVEKLVGFRPDEARALLDEAGWKPGQDGIREKAGQRLKLTISTTAGRRQRELSEQVLQQHLRDVGIELGVENHNATAFFAPFEQDGVLKRGRFQLAMYAWIGSPDPDKHSLYHTTQIPRPSGQNHSRHSNARLDQLLEENLRTLDVDERKAMVWEIQKILATELPFTSLVWRADLDPMTSQLENFKPNPTQTGDTWNAWEWKLRD